MKINKEWFVDVNERINYLNVEIDALETTRRETLKEKTKELVAECLSKIMLDDEGDEFVVGGFKLYPEPQIIGFRAGVEFCIPVTKIWKKRDSKE